MPKRNPRAGLFNGWFTDLQGNRIRRIRQSEYPELYRLHSLGTRLGLTRASKPVRWHTITDETWEACQEEAERRDAYSNGADNTRVWNPKHNLLGTIGEKLYASVTGQPMSGSIVDGGQDFPGVDVKTTPHHQDPKLLRLQTDPLKAPFYVLVAVDLDKRRARIVGHATRTDLEQAPTYEYGHGPTRTLLEHQLTPGLPL